MPFCPDCGTENASSQKFCTNCGKALVAVTASPESPDPGARPQPPVQPIPPAPGSPPGSSLVPALIVIFFVIVIIGAAAVYFVGLPLLNKNMQPAGSASGTTPAPTAVPVYTQNPVTPEQTIAVIATPAGTLPPAEVTQPAMEKFSSSQHDFSIDYPAGWEVNEMNSLETPSLTRYQVVEFKSPSQERCDNERSGCETIWAVMTVEVENSPGTTEVADYYVSETSKILRESGATITKRDAMYKLSGVKAYRFDYENEVNDKEQRLLSAYTIINKKAYILTYRAYAPIRGETDLFEKYYNDADAMFESFKA